jgi:cell filamentation protein
MSNDYKYIDSDYIYKDPKTGVLRNLVDITEEDVLQFVESGAVTKRAKELYENPIKINNTASLFAVHKHLFQDIYAWAGKGRSIEINKDGKQFFPTSHFENAFKYIDSLISEYKKIRAVNKKELAYKLAEILDNVNYLHPFREGNGRAQREFMRLLALEKGLNLNLNPPDNADVYEQYMQGTINSDVNQLTKLILELIESEKNNEA